VLYGKTVSTDEIFDEVMKDKAFYENSGGGVTLSGGECLCQAEFCAKLLKKLKDCGINTAVDTCGYVQRSAVDLVLPYTDTFLYDLKAADADVHERCTGHSNALILENLRHIDRAGKRIEIRVPYVPGYNSDQMEKIRDIVKELRNVVAVKVLSYHNFAASKYRALGMENTLPGPLPDKEELQRVQDMFDPA
jgi:pyruvate formate lyase activating enzyme